MPNENLPSHWVRFLGEGPEYRSQVLARALRDIVEDRPGATEHAADVLNQWRIHQKAVDPTGQSWI
jgi:hypothetical protein